MILAFLGLEWLGGRPVGAHLVMMIASVGLPPVLAFGMGALVGPRILAMRPGNHARAAAWGAAAAFGGLLLWVLLLEGIPRLLPGPVQATGGGGDVPGAAEVVGYVVLLPLVLVLTLLMGAAAGLILHIVASYRATDREA
jgi:hypothetical protein